MGKVALGFKPEDRKFKPDGIIGIFHRIILPTALWPWRRFSLNKNECQEYFNGCKGCQCVGLATLPFNVPIVMKFGSLSLLEPSGPLQACTGWK
jgi:hypothetical protein